MSVKTHIYSRVNTPQPRILTEEESRQMKENLAQKDFGMSLEEFTKAWLAGEFDGDRAPSRKGYRPGDDAAGVLGRLTTEEISNWQNLEEIGAGDGVPTECERCGKPGTPRQQFMHMGLSSAISARMSALMSCGRREVGPSRLGKCHYPRTPQFSSWYSGRARTSERKTPCSRSHQIARVGTILRN